MRCHLATAVTIDSPSPVNPARAAIRFLTEPLSDGLYLSDHLIAGATASAAAVAALHPMDTLKTVIQKAATATNPSVTSAASSSGSLNALSALALTLRTGGIPSLYRGLSPSLIGQVPAGAIKFAAYESLTQVVKSISPKFGSTAVSDFTCAAVAFVVCSVVLVPGELLKQRLQAGAYSSFSSAVKSMFKQGIRTGFYTGYRATLVRDVPYTMLEFGLYAQFKRIMKNIVLSNKRPLTSQEELILGGVAGGLTGFLTTPLDLAKTRLMTQSVAGPGMKKEYSGIADCLIKVAKNEGVQGLFKGSAARVIWLVPFTALYFGVHEATKRALLSRKLDANGSNTSTSSHLSQSTLPADLARDKKQT